MERREYPVTLPLCFPETWCVRCQKWHNVGHVQCPHRPLFGEIKVTAAIMISTFSSRGRGGGTLTVTGLDCCKIGNPLRSPQAGSRPYSEMQLHNYKHFRSLCESLNCATPRNPGFAGKCRLQPFPSFLFTCFPFIFFSHSFL